MASLHPFPLVISSQEESSLCHVTCFEQWDNSKLDESRDLKERLHISFSLGSINCPETMSREQG